MQKEQLTPILTNYIKDIRQVLAADFSGAKLYGSYARGNFTDESDIDIVIFTDKRPDEYMNLIEKTADITMHYNLTYDIWISPVFQNEKLFKQREHAVPYYQNIEKEGIVLG